MNKNKGNVYVRLQTYYSLLTGLNYLDSNPDDFSITAIHEHTLLPLPLIREDFAQILLWQAAVYSCNTKEKNPFLFMMEGPEQVINYLFFDLDDTEYEDLQEYADPKESKDNTKKIAELICKGKLDDVPLVIELNSSSRQFRLPLTFDEATALDALKKDIHSDTNPAKNDTTSSKKDMIPSQKENPVYFQIKDNYRAVHDYRELIDKLEELESAIKHHYTLNMEYLPNSGKKITCELRPLKISYDETENLYCVLSFQDGKIFVNRLDCIKKLTKLSKPTQPRQKTKEDIAGEKLIETLAPQVWGNCFFEEPQQVKVKFYNEANVWEKVRRDLSCRTKGQLYEKDGFLYYEDTVYGISKFRPWIYGFGSSAIVLKPKSLREHIIASLKERKDRDQI